MSYPIYATSEELAEYLGGDTPNSERLLKRASEFIYYLVYRNIRPSNPSHLQAVKQATCAQVEYWLEAGEATAIMGGFKSFSLGDLSMDFGENNKGTASSLSSRAQYYLNLEGLLYRGVRI